LRGIMPPRARRQAIAARYNELLAATEAGKEQAAVVKCCWMPRFHFEDTGIVRKGIFGALEILKGDGRSEGRIDVYRRDSKRVFERLQGQCCLAQRKATCARETPCVGVEIAFGEVRVNERKCGSWLPGPQSCSRLLDRQAPLLLKCGSAYDSF